MGLLDALAAVGNAGGGFVQGYQTAQKMKDEQATRELKSEMLKLQMEEAKFKLKQHELQGKVFDTLSGAVGGQPGGQAPTEAQPQADATPFQDPGAVARGDAMFNNASQRMGAMGMSAPTPVYSSATPPPMQAPRVQAPGATAMPSQAMQRPGDRVAALLSDPVFLAQAKMAGLDWTAIAQYIRQNEHQQWERGPKWDWQRQQDVIKRGQEDQRIALEKAGLGIRGAEFQRGYQETVPVEIISPDGSKAQVRLPRFGGPGAITQSPPGIQMPIPDDQIPNWRNEKGESPAVGISPQQAMVQGFKRVSTNEATGMSGVKAAQEVLSRTEQLLNDIFPQEGGLLERSTGGMGRTAGAWTQASPKAALFRSFTEGTLAPMVRTMGERGNLSDKDIERGIQMIPKLSDSATVARGKLQQLKEFVNEIQAAPVKTKSKEQAPDFVFNPKTGKLEPAK